MSLAQPNRGPKRPPGRMSFPLQVGVGLLAVTCVVLILLSAAAKVQDAADRTH
jgi:hypothetical protein